MYASRRNQIMDNGTEVPTRLSFIVMKKKGLLQWGSVQTDLHVASAGAGTPEALSLNKHVVYAAQVTPATVGRMAPPTAARSPLVAATSY